MRFYFPLSPDSNPLDYYAWGFVDRETNQQLHTTKHTLKATIVDLMANRIKNHLICAYTHYQGLVEVVL